MKIQTALSNNDVLNDYNIHLVNVPFNYFVIIENYELNEANQWKQLPTLLKSLPQKLYRHS